MPFFNNTHCCEDDDSAPQPQKPAPEPPAEEGDKYRALYDYRFR